MKIEIKVPSLGESITEATVSQILIANHSVIQTEKEILELETDKVNQVIYASQAGEVTLNVDVGTKVKVGEVIGFIDTSVASAATQKESVKLPPNPPSVKPTETSSVRQDANAFVASLQAPVAAPSPLPSSIPVNVPKQAGTRKKMSALRRTIATRLVEVKNTTAMLTTFNEVDMSKIIEIRAREKEAFTARYGARLGFMSFFIKASVAALKAFPEVNASIEGDEIVYSEGYHIGVAVSTEKGLMVPVLNGCEALSFGEIEKQLEAYAKKAREGKISVEDLRGGSFTITNGGVFGSLLSTPILNPPQSAILGMHAIVKRPIAENDQVVIRPMMYLALSYDHRIIDGKQAVQFLVHLKESLEDPARLLLDL